jgi:phenylpyruvate tautomerase PptA (4-oxalocrotonate tautomerase family)
MPYLQLDVNGHYASADKRRLAASMSETYARMMSVDIRRISVAVRELGEGSLWRIAAEGEAPTAVSVMMLDIRKGRSAELRMAVAQALCAHCVDSWGCAKTVSTWSSPNTTAMRCTTRRLVASAPTGRRTRAEAGPDPSVVLRPLHGRIAASAVMATSAVALSTLARRPPTPRRQTAFL